jgi:hypothetical protein
VADGVARRTPQAEQLHLGLGQVAPDGGEVHVAVPVDLGGAHDHVAAARPDDVEHAAVGVPGLEDLALGPLEGLVVGDERGLAVGHHEVGLEGGPGEAAADHGDGADGVGQDLAVAPEGLGDGHGADVGAGEGHDAHRAATFCW